MNRIVLTLLAIGGMSWALRRARPAPDGPRIRDAGPEQMRDPPPDWDATDEASDESFPASDPPSTY